MSKKPQLKQNNSPKPTHGNKTHSKLDELDAVLETLPPDKSREIKEKVHTLQRISYMESVSYSGPLPHPDMLKKYNEAVPDGAERILKMVEKQSEHRMAIEKFAIEEQFKQSKRGQNYGFSLALLFLLATGLFVFTGHIEIAAILAAIDIVSLASVFVIGKWKQKENLSEKDPDKN